MARLVIKSHRPLQFSLAVVLLSMLVAFVTWLGLDESHWSVIRDRLQSNRDQKLLWEVNQGLEEENAKLRERVSMLERTTSLDTQTATLLQEEIKNLQEETFRLKGELEFFQGIMEAVGEVKLAGLESLPLIPDGRGAYVPLGDYTVTLVPASEGELAATFVDNGGPLEVEGTAKLDASRTYTIDALVEPRADAPETLIQGLNIMTAEPDAEGRRRLNLTGSL